MTTPQTIEYHFYDFVTGAYQATLPINGPKFGDLLNTSATFSGSVPIVASDPEIAALNPWDVTVPGKGVVVIDIGGTPVSAYLITARNRKMSPQGISISGKSVYWWLTKRLQATDYSNPPASGLTGSMALWNVQPQDPTLIAAQLISDALSNYWYNSVATGLNVLGGLSVLINGKTPNAGAPVSVNTVAPTYPYSSLQSLDSIIQQLVGLGWQTGFDIYFVIAYASGPRSALVATIHIDYPRSGRSASSNGVVVDMNRADNYSADEDFEKTGSIQYEKGVPGTVYVVDNTFPRQQGWPLTEKVQSRSSLSGPNAPGYLKAIGNSDSFLFSYPVFSITVTMPLWGLDPQLGGFETGDNARLLYTPVTAGSARGNGDYNFPAGFDTELRIVGWSVTVPDEGYPTIDVVLAVPPAATASAAAV